MKSETTKRAFLLVLTLTALVWVSPAPADSPAELRAVAAPDAVEVFVGEELFTAYKVGSHQKYPYFYPVNGPASGRSVTTESSEPFPHHQSLFFGCDKVNGGNYWQESIEQGQIVSVALRIIKDRGCEVSFENTCEWRKPGEAPVVRDTRTVRISAPSSNLRLIDFEIVLTPLTDIRIERTNHSLFAARMKPELSVASGGTLLNAFGDSGEAETFGKAAPWCDYYGEHEGVIEGLAIFQHPLNPLAPAPWFTRNYGFFSPTPMYWPPNGSHFAFAAGENITLRYRVVVHAGNTEEAGIPGLYGEYAPLEPPAAASESTGE